MFDRPAHCNRRLPTAVEPVNTSPSTSMCSANGSPASLPKPGTTLNTPAGMPASIASSASRIALSGDFSEGFSTIELPVASAGASFHAAISIGKFHGTIAPTTPSGSRVTRPSSSGPVAAISPYTLSSASPVQLTQRIVAATSTWRASVTGLPMSSDSSSASSSPCVSISRANFSSTFLRWVGFALAQAPVSKLRRAAATARSISSLPPSATFASTRPSIGLTQSKVLPLAAST